MSDRCTYTRAQTKRQAASAGRYGRTGPCVGLGRALSPKASQRHSQSRESLRVVKESQDREIKVEVMRIGQITGSASIQYATEDRQCISQHESQ